MNENNKKEITLDDLAKLITETRTSLEGKILGTEKSLEEKILGTEKSLEEKILGTEKSLEEKIDSAVEEIATMTQKEFIKMDGKMNKGFSEINSKIDNLELEVKNRRVHIFTHKDLEQRVEKLEDNWKKYKPMIQKIAKC